MKYLKQFLLDGAKFYGERADYKEEHSKKTKDKDEASKLILEAAFDYGRANGFLEILKALEEHKFII